MDDSEPADDGLLSGLRWNRSPRDQAQLKHKIRDLPGLLKHGLHLRKKSVSISLVVDLLPRLMLLVKKNKKQNKTNWIVLKARLALLLYIRHDLSRARTLQRGTVRACAFVPNYPNCC